MRASIFVYHEWALFLAYHKWRQAFVVNVIKLSFAALQPTNKRAQSTKNPGPNRYTFDSLFVEGYQLFTGGISSTTTFPTMYR